MEIPECLKKYTTKPSDCPKYDKNNPDYRCSVDYDKSKYRINKALQESKNKTVPPSTICGYINEFLSLMGINSQAVMINGLDILMTINYEHIKRLYKLNEQSDIIWLRFTNDGYCGTVGSSNDINYSYNTNSGKIIKAINKEWNNYIIIIVPIPGIENREQRLLIEHMIGYYLSDNKNVPIIDYYSHFLGK